MPTPSFSDEQWARIYELAQSMVEIATPDRLRYLESHSTDPAMTAEVLALVENLDSPEEDEGSLAGSRIGRFELRKFIGDGGSGEVYSAYDPDLAREVAIKILRADYNAAPDASERLIREARTASMLNHQGIVTIYEIIRRPVGIAIVMELLKGGTLRELCRGVPLEIPRLRKLGSQIAEALGAAHGAGIVHRDIKPENIILLDGDRVKVLDFGLARLDVIGNQSSNTSLPAGTLRYMSPEHYRGQEPTRQSDIFAFGLLLYELAAGEHPFHSRHSIDALAAIATEAIPPPSVKNPKIPAQLDDLLLRMLAKDPQARPSAIEAAQALQESDELLPSPAAARWGRKRIVRFALSTLISSLAAGYAVWRSLPGPPLFSEMQQVTQLIEENHTVASAISPDGKYLAYANADGVFLQIRASGAVSSLPGPAHELVNHLSWFPDSIRLIASAISPDRSQSSIWAVSALGAPVRLLRRDSKLGTVSPDGEKLAFLGGTESSIWTMKEGQSPERIVDAPPEVSFRGLHWLPNSRHLIAMQHRVQGSGENASAEDDIDSIDASTGALADQLRKVTARSAVFFPDGELYLSSSRRLTGDGETTLFSLRMSLSTGRFASKPKRLPTPAEFAAFDCRDLTVTANGSKLAMIRRQVMQSVFVADFDRHSPHLSNFRRLTLDENANYPHSWTGDSKAVIYESNRGLRGYDLYKHYLDSRLPEAITATPGLDEFMAQVAPDGISLLYASAKHRTPGRALMRTSLTGGETEELPTGGSLEEFRCSPHRQGRCVLKRKIGTTELVFLELDPYIGVGKELARVPGWPSLYGDWDLSPDGRFALLPNHDPRSAKVRMIKLDSNRPGALDREVTLPGLTDLSVVSSTPDGRGWFLSVDTSEGHHLYFYDFSGSVTFLGPIQGWAVPSPDGKKVAFLDYVVRANAWIMNRGP